MSVIKLADELKRCLNDGSTNLVCVKEAAKMLRQQAKEIAQLKEKNEAMRFHIVHGEHMPQMSDFL